MCSSDLCLSPGFISGNLGYANGANAGTKSEKIIIVFPNYRMPKIMLAQVIRAYPSAPHHFSVYTKSISNP